MIRFIDKFLNAITMYRLVMYGLLLLAGVSVVLGFVGIVPYRGWQLLLSVIILLVTCYFTNIFFAKIFRAPTNVESSAITALILFLILYPITTGAEALVTIVAGVIAMASKYLLAYHKKHIFNPAAIALVLIGVVGRGEGIWWVGTTVLTPLVAILGLLIVRKIRRFHLFLSFLIASLITIILFGLKNDTSIAGLLPEVLLSWPLVFFATVMLTEPATMPPTHRLQVVYGVIVGVLFGSQFHFGPFFSTPEFALVVGNLFAYIVSPKQRVRLTLEHRGTLAADIHELVFTPDETLRYRPGQYMEWTLPHAHPDTRGNRRYFTIASSPTEKVLRLGVKIQKDQSSSFKRALLGLEKGKELTAAHVAGDFCLPEDTHKKLLCIAGGIGVTPFRSMVQYLIDKKETRDMVLLYTAATADGFAYRDLFEQAKAVGVKTVCILTNTENVPTNWTGKTGRITEALIREVIPDYGERIAYLSGPNAMVQAYKELLRSLGLRSNNIMTDYFPGF